MARARNGGLFCRLGTFRTSFYAVDRHENLAAAAAWAAAPRLAEDQLDGDGQSSRRWSQPGRKSLPALRASQAAPPPASYVDRARRSQVADQAREIGVGHR